MKTKSLFSLLILFYCMTYINAQDNEVLEFNNKPITDILSVLADLGNMNIIVDETVKGDCSFYFSTNNIEESFKIFLKNQNLYTTILDNIILISKIYTSIDQQSNITINCVDSDIQLILNRLSTLTGITILYDKLPTSSVTLNVKELNLDVILEIIMKKIPEYDIEINTNYIYINKLNINEGNSDETTLKSTNGITLDAEGLYSINLNKVRFSSVIKELFNEAKTEYSVQGRNDNILENLYFNNKTFDELLNIILESGSCDYVISNNIYYIFDITKVEISNKHIKTQVIKLENIKVEELLKLLPGSFMSNNVIKIHEKTNSIIVYGTIIKTTPIIDFIKLIDIDINLTPRWIKMNFISAELFRTLLLKSYDQSSIITVDDNSFLILLDDDEYKKVTQLKENIDTPLTSHKITLKYIKSENLLNNLPKSISSKSIVETENPSVLFFYGEDEAFNNFIQILDQLDKPVPQIKYKVLVLQNTLGENRSFGLNINSHSQNNGDITLPDDEWSAFSGALGNLMNLNFNVLSAFGPLFSFELNASIQENKTKVLVDTTLQGVSGKEVNFRNTTTSRFYQNSTDVDGETETGATQEVSWGIILDIKGWSSGDGMVTVNIKSTISDETTVTGESSGIPSTSEKIVNTEVRTKEGIPVVIGGLISSKKEIAKDKTPILGEIPIIGHLFSNDVEIETQSEFVIYLIPYIEKNFETEIDEKMKKAYQELM